MQSYRSWRYLGLEHKRGYQRNMLTSMLLVTLLTLLLVVVGGLFHTDAPTMHGVAVRMTGESLARHWGTRGGSGDGATMHESLFSGGFVDIPRIVQDRAYDAVIPALPGNEQSFMPSLIDYEDIEPGVYTAGYGSVSGAGYGDGENDFGLPDERGLFPVRYKVTPPRLPDIRMNMNRDGVIRAGNVRWPGFPAKPTDTGFVVVDITIHKDATISYRFVSVDPPGRGFRVAAERAIVRDYDYEPRIVRGESVETTVRLSLTICLECQPEIRQMSGLEGFHVYIGE